MLPWAMAEPHPYVTDEDLEPVELLDVSGDAAEAFRRALAEAEGEVARMLAGRLLEGPVTPAWPSYAEMAGRLRPETRKPPDR